VPHHLHWLLLTLPCLLLLLTICYAAEAYEGDQLRQLVAVPDNVRALLLRLSHMLLCLTMLCTAEAYEGDQLRQLVAALCPTIYGHELVKAGLLLSLFGGVRKHGSSNNRVRLPATPHIYVGISLEWCRLAVFVQPHHSRISIWRAC
jgi:hypothetical protein